MASEGNVQEKGKGKLFSEHSQSSDSLRNDTKNRTCHYKDREDLIVKLVALLFVRNCVKNQEFYIGCNIQKAEIFGDLLLKFIDEQGPKIWMVHINYINDACLQKSQCVNVFDLIVYLNSVNLITKHFKENETLNCLGSFQDFHFALYTNNILSNTFSSCFNPTSKDILNTEQNVVRRVFNEINENVCPFYDELIMYKVFLETLCIGGDIIGKISTFKRLITTVEIKEKLCFLEGNPTEEYLQTLLGEVQGIESSFCILFPKLKVFGHQASEVELTELIKTEIYQLNTNILSTQILYQYLVKSLKNWYLSCNYLLTKDCPLYRDFYSMLEKYSEIPKTCLEVSLNFNIKFFVFPIKDIMKHIINHSCVNIIASGNELSLTCIKIHQILENLLFQKYIWITFETLTKWKDDILNLWPNDKFPILVVEYSAQHDCSSIINELKPLLRSHKNAKLIIISSDSKKCEPSLKNAFSKEFFEVKDTFTFLDLDDQSQSKVLQAEVKFQSDSIPFGLLVGQYNELKGILTASIVSKLLKKDSFFLGPPLNEFNQSFISRSLELSVDLDINILKLPTHKETFAVSGITEVELRKIVQNEDVESFPSNHEMNYNCSIFCLPTEEVENVFSTLCDHFPLRNNHHFVYRNGYLYWKESRGQTQYLKDYFIIAEHARHVWNVVDETKHSKYMPQTLLDIVKHQVIVLGESGMGKSTLLQFLQKNTKQQAPLNWLIHLNFNNDISLISKTKKEDYDCEVIIQILYSLLNCEYHASEMEHILLRHDLEKRGNVIVTCEGLESVGSKYIDKVFEFIHALDTMNIKKLWIMSTPNMKKILQKSFSTVAYELQCLTIENQQCLLLSLWKDKFDRSNFQKLKDFISALQKVCKVSEKAEVSLLAFPLICVMAAETFEIEASKYISLGNVDWPEIADEIHLYDKYFQIKKLQNIKSLDHSLPSLSSHELEEFFVNQHMLCALLTLLDIEELAELNLLDILDNISKIVENIKRFGIIQGIVNKKPTFCHRTFAEYFAGLWFSQNIEKSRRFFKHKWFDMNFNSLSRFFDYFLIRGHELHTAVLKNDIQTVESLIEFGVDVNSVDKGGRTALHLAIIYSKSPLSSYPAKSSEYDTYDRITKLLVLHSINTKMMDNVFLWRPVQYAIELRKWDAMDLLLNEQVSFNDIDSLKEKINDISFIQEGMLIGSEKGYFNLIECFSSCGVNIIDYILETKEGSYNPFHTAARYGQLKLVRFFLSKKVKISIKNNKGITPLHLAASEGMIEVLMYLLQRGADLHCTDKDGNTPLNFAILGGDLNMIILLIEQYHANISFQNKFGDTALHQAVKVGHTTIIEFILMKEAEINMSNRDGNTALHLAVWLGALPIVKLLIEYGADVNICNKNGDTPLSQNAGGGNLDIVKILIENGSDVNNRADDGNTALHWAARQDSVSVVEYLLEKGADINAQNKYGNTSLHRAVENGCLSTTKLLVNAGTNIQLRNSAGYSVGNIRSRSKEVSESIACLV